MKGLFWRACMNFRQKYFALLLCHSTFEMFSITIHVIIFFQSEQWKKLLANKLLVIFAITVTPSNTEILKEHTVNHIFQYSNGEAVHPVIKDFQKIQNYVGSLVGSNSEGNSRENFKTARNRWICIHH